MKQNKTLLGNVVIPEEAILTIRDYNDEGYYNSMKHAEDILDIRISDDE